MSEQSATNQSLTSKTLSSTQIKDLVLGTLDDFKALELKAIDTHKLNDLVDWMVFASGSSARHVRSLTDNLAVQMKQHAIKPIGIEGKENAIWTLVDLGDVLVHIMQKDVRDYYQLEKLWSTEKEADAG